MVNVSFFLFIVCASLLQQQCLGYLLSPRIRGISSVRVNSVQTIRHSENSQLSSSSRSRFSQLQSKVENKENDSEEAKEPSAFDQVASKGLAGVLAIAAAEAIFWALGVPLASLWVKYTTGEWIDLMTTDGQLQAAGFSFGYGGFATLILQYRVTLFAIPLVPIMEKLVVTPGKKYFGEKFGEKKTEN